MSMLGIYTTLDDQLCGHYKVTGRIGSGAMGDVYEARDVLLDRVVAIKVLPHWARGDPEARSRFLREARAASTFNHPNIVTVYEIFEHQGVHLLAMEYLPGKTLQTIIPARGLELEVALPLGVEIASALSAAHKAGILHHDLKPSNIMLTKDRHAKLVDFGLAEILRGAWGTEAEKKGKQPGTRVYMAPEQLEGQKGDHRSEIFVFGMLLYQMLTGRHAFAATTTSQIVASICSEWRPTVPARVPFQIAELIYRCLERDPAKRHESMEAVLAILTPALPPKANPWRSETGENPDNKAIRRLKALVTRIRYDNLPESRKALLEIRQGSQATLPEKAKGQLISELKRLLTTLPDFGPQGIPSSVREIRQLLFSVLRDTVDDRLDFCFETHDLEHLDLYSLDFKSCHMPGLSLQNSFLVGSSFENSVMQSTSIAGAWIRNVNFRGADLRGADFTDADWFNALNLTEEQVTVVARGTLRPCPQNVRELRHLLSVRYAHPFDSWSEAVREQLLLAWNAYLRPGGLKDVIARF